MAVAASITLQTMTHRGWCFGGGWSGALVWRLDIVGHPVCCRRTDALLVVTLATIVLFALAILIGADVTNALLLSPKQQTNKTTEIILESPE